MTVWGSFPAVPEAVAADQAYKEERWGLIIDPHQDLRNKTQPAKKFRKISGYNDKGIGQRLISIQATNVPSDQRYLPDTNRTEVDIPQRLQRAHRNTYGTQTGPSHLKCQHPDKEIQKFTIAQEGPAQVIHVDHVIEKFRTKNVRYILLLKPKSVTTYLQHITYAYASSLKEPFAQTKKKI